MCNVPLLDALALCNNIIVGDPVFAAILRGKRRFAGGLGSSHLRSLATYSLSRPGGFAIFAALRKATSAVTSGTGRVQRRLCLLMGRLYVGLSGAAHKSSWRARITACQHCRAVTQHHKSVRIMWRRPVCILTVLRQAASGAQVRALRRHSRRLP